MPSFDYAIVGAGAAGLHLAMHLAEDSFFSTKKILILDRDLKEANDRTWSFWEKEASRWDQLTIKKWKKALFYSSTKTAEIPLKEYEYKTLRSSAFYSYAKEVIRSSGRFQWVTDEVDRIEGKKIFGKKETYEADHIFDSRMPVDYASKKENHPTLIQHFIGWFIETPTPAFDDQSLTMMDYRIRWKDQTSFHYVLPFSPTYALVEFTLFNSYLIATEDYEQVLQRYIEEMLGISDYQIVEKEVGQVPMSTYPFHHHHQQNVTKIGTAGGWVRPSSGYSFKNAERYSKMIVENLKKGKIPHEGIATSRFRLYDSIFLGVLKERNDLGEEIFQTLYTKHPSRSLFRFLDERSNLLEDAKIMLSLNQPIFRKTLVKSLRNRQ